MPTSATGGIHTLATARHKMLKIFFIAFMITHFSYQCQPRQSENNSDGRAGRLLSSGEAADIRSTASLPQGLFHRKFWKRDALAPAGRLFFISFAGRRNVFSRKTQKRKQI